MSENIKISPELRVTMKTVGEMFRSAALEYVYELNDAGVPLEEAGSIVANIMVREALVVAGSAKIDAVKGAPDIEKFVSACRAMAETVKWMIDDKQGEKDG